MIHYGLAGWSYADWDGRVYPRPKRAGFHALPFLARYVDLMELNSSFYALPNPKHAAHWVALLANHPDFRFTAKLHQSFTHGPLDGIDPRAAEAFSLGLAPLVDAGRLLCVLVQFPASFRAGPAAWTRFERIRGLFPDTHLVAELRPRPWFEDAAMVRLQRLAYGLAHIDLPAATDHPPADHPSLGELAYLRLHGRNSAAWFDAQAGRDDRYDYRYSEPEVEALARRLERVASRSEKALLVANNHFGGQALAATLEIKATITGQRVAAPTTLLDTYPDLVRIADGEGFGGQQTLF